VNLEVGMNQLGEPLGVPALDSGKDREHELVVVPLGRVAAHDQLLLLAAATGCGPLVAAGTPAWLGS
jgi:hypothetical protein